MSTPFVEIIAHRGSSFAAPENTLASAHIGWSEKADALELDLWLTRDSELVVLHDETTQRTGGFDARIGDLTLDEARRLDVGIWKAPAFRGERIPTLSEMLATVPDGKRVFIELKTGPEGIPILKASVDRSALAIDQVVIISFDAHVAYAAKRALPGTKVFLLAEYIASAFGDAMLGQALKTIIDAAEEGNLDGLDLDYRWPLSIHDAQDIKSRGLEMFVWTVDDPETARHWMELGVGGITTNRPGWLRHQLARSQLH